MGLVFFSHLNHKPVQTKRSPNLQSAAHHQRVAQCHCWCGTEGNWGAVSLPGVACQPSARPGGAFSNSPSSPSLTRRSKHTSGKKASVLPSLALSCLGMTATLHITQPIFHIILHSTRTTHIQTSPLGLDNSLCRMQIL